MKASVTRALLTSVAVFLALSGFIVYYFLGTPQYSSHLIKSAIVNHDLDGFRARVDLDAITEAAAHFALVTEERELYEYLKLYTGEPNDSVVRRTQDLWAAIEVPVKESLAHELNAGVRELVEGGSDEASVTFHSPEYVVRSVRRNGHIALAEVVRRDGQPVWVSGNGPVLTLHLHMRQVRDRRWDVVEVAEVDQAAVELMRRTVWGIPGMKRARMYRQEEAALHALLTLNLAEGKYASTFGHFGALTELERANLIGADLASGEQQGYRFRVRVTDADYYITAVPAVFGSTGSRAFYSDKSGIIHESDGQEAASLKSPEVGSH